MYQRNCALLSQLMPLKITFLNHVGTGLRPVHTSFLEIEFYDSVCASVPMCPPLRQVVTSSLTWILYRIMQIVRGGKLSRLHDLIVIRGKTFAIVKQFETPYNRKKKFAGKPSRLEANPRKPRKFSTANDLHYTVYNASQKFMH